MRDFSTPKRGSRELLEFFSGMIDTNCLPKAFNFSASSGVAPIEQGAYLISNTSQVCSILLQRSNQCGIPAEFEVSDLAMHAPLGKEKMHWYPFQETASDS